MRRRQSEDVTINLTPMIDVVFLLVIFFMVGSKFSEAESRMNVSVPSVGQLRSIARTPDDRVVEVTADGVIALDGQNVTLPQLAGELRMQVQNYPGLKVVVRADASSSLQHYFEVLHAVKSSGVEQMGVAARVNHQGTRY